jgi:hypothetical protein
MKKRINIKDDFNSEDGKANEQNRRLRERE